MLFNFILGTPCFEVTWNGGGTFSKDRAKLFYNILISFIYCLAEHNIHHQNILTKMPSILNEIETRVLTIDPKEHTQQYPFENLVFNGGGAKTISYVGAVKVMKKKSS
jgi:hypothetical protein